MSGTELVPYRYPGIVPEEEPFGPKLIAFGSGCLYRSPPTSPPHKCKPPSLLKRIRKGIKPDDVWFCSCGNGVFKCLGRFVGWSDYTTLETTINYLCEINGIERPYQNGDQNTDA